MHMGNRLVFLGTGGGKNVMFTQVRKTGGIFIELDNVKLILDPGPGSLVQARRLKLRPETWDALLLSHLHPDHATDANAYLDGMKEPVLIAEEHCILPDKSWKRQRYDYYPCISSYHAKKAKAVYALRPGRAARIGDLEVTAVEADHYDPTIGFVISGSKRIGYPADGTYFRGQEAHYEGCDLLVLNVLVPSGMPAKAHWHMSVDNAIALLGSMKAKPTLAVIQHFSFYMLRAGVQAQARSVAKETGVPCIAAEDSVAIDLDALVTGGARSPRLSPRKEKGTKR